MEINSWNLHFSSNIYLKKFFCKTCVCRYICNCMCKKIYIYNFFKNPDSGDYYVERQTFNAMQLRRWTSELFIHSWIKHRKHLKNVGSTNPANLPNKFGQMNAGVGFPIHHVKSSGLFSQGWPGWPAARAALLVPAGEGSGAGAGCCFLRNPSWAQWGSRTQ